MASEALRQKLALDRTKFFEGTKVQPVSFGAPRGSQPSTNLSGPRAPIEVSSSDDEDEPSPNTVPRSHGRFGEGNLEPHAPAPMPLYQTSNGVRPLFYKDGKPMPAPIPIPSNLPRDNQPSASAPDDDNEEKFAIEVPYEYEDRQTADEAQRAMRELVSGALGALTLEDVDLSEAVVEGFKEGITLMPHQVQGRAWMRERESKKKTGGILADMGLGKTIQTLARIVEGKPTRDELKAGRFAKTTLIVAPVSLLPQWASEIEKMCEGLKVIKHHGASRTTSAEALRKADVVITTYSTLSSEHATHQGGSKAKNAAKAKQKAPEVESDSGSDDSLVGKSTKVVKKKGSAKAGPKAKAKPSALFEVNFWRVVLDEAQNIKNANTKAAQGCCALQGKYRWVLTGTPIQNNVDELFSLLKFLKIRPLNDWDNFRSQISKPVQEGRSKNAMKRLHIVLQAVMLRRTKNQTIDGVPIISLPDRTVEVIICQFDEDERAFYTALEARTSVTMNKYIEQGEVMKNYTSVLLLLLRLRQACDHPGLLSKDFLKDADALESKPAAPPGEEEDDKKEVDELAGLMDTMGLSTKAPTKCDVCQIDLPQGHKNKYCVDCEASVAETSRRKSILAPAHKGALMSLDDDSGEDNDLPPTSTKIRKMLELLKMIRQRTEGKVDENGRKLPAEKTIIFSQFTTMLDIIEPFLVNGGIRYTRYDGSMKPAHREEALEKVRNNAKTNVILISFKAGGTGLNLTACNNVILMDLWWNPALEDQAFDRAHRLGQKKSVWIYKLTVEETVEARILALQEEKRALAMAALSGGKIIKGGLGLDDILKIFNRRTAEDDDSDED